MEVNIFRKFPIKHILFIIIIIIKNTHGNQQIFKNLFLLCELCHRAQGVDVQVSRLIDNIHHEKNTSRERDGLNHRKNASYQLQSCVRRQQQQLRHVLEKISLSL